MTALFFEPAESPLEFVRNRCTRTVHVLVPLQDGDGKMFDGAVDYGDLTSWFRTRLLCGRVVPANDFFAVERFDDGTLCMRCHAAMGEHSDRLFWHEQD